MEQSCKTPSANPEPWSVQVSKFIADPSPLRSKQRARIATRDLLRSRARVKGLDVMLHNNRACICDGFWNARLANCTERHARRPSDWLPSPGTRHARWYCSGENIVFEGIDTINPLSVGVHEGQTIVLMFEKAVDFGCLIRRTQNATSADRDKT